MDDEYRLGEHAAVIGGSLGGLLAARVLSEFFDRVTIFERDGIPDGPEPRKGVPQGRHVHTLYGRGAEVVERLLPGFFQEFVEAGGVEADFSRDLKWFHHGVWKLRTDSGLKSWWSSRPFLEHQVRQRVLAIDGIECRQKCDVAGFLTNESRTGVTGLRLGDDNDGGETVAADLVVDASGRGSRTPARLEELGYRRPAEEQVQIDLTYASRMFERADDPDRDWQILGVFATPPNQTRTGYIFPIENNRWLASCVGYLGDGASDDEENWLAFAKSLEQPDFHQLVSTSKPVTPISVFKYPCHLRRHYERLTRFPNGLMVMGDAVCSFNPVYGQGMSVCALQAGELQSVLRIGGSSGRMHPGLPQELFKRSSKLIDNPWLLATISFTPRRRAEDRSARCSCCGTSATCCSFRRETNACCDRSWKPCTSSSHRRRCFSHESCWTS